HSSLPSIPLFCLTLRRPPPSPPSPYTTLFRSYPVKRFARANPFLDPGGCWVSYLCCEPRVALAVLEQMHAYPRVSRLLDVRFRRDRKSTRLNSSHVKISYAVFCLKKKKQSINY